MGQNGKDWEGRRLRHTTSPQMRHLDSGGSRAGKNAEFLLIDPRHPDLAFIQRELDRDRKHEHVLIPVAIVAVLVVAVLVVIRQLFFV
jgi:hypothetical protein